MIQLHLLDIAKKQMPSLDLKEEGVAIKIEKLLKAEAKLDQNIRINDIENLLVFLKNHSVAFLPILENKHIRKILNGKGETINYAPFNQTGISEETLENFQQVFAGNTKAYLEQCIRINAWHSLKSVFVNYSFLLDQEIVSQIFDTLSHKNQSIINAIYNDQYIAFVNANPYSKDAGYYATLSALDPFYFDEDVMSINNAVCAKQKTTLEKKRYLGNILYAATYFNACTDSLQSVLASNQQVALQWTNPYNAGTSSSSSKSVWSVVIYIVIAIIVLFAVFTLSPGAAGVSGMVIILIARLVHAAMK